MEKKEVEVNFKAAFEHIDIKATGFIEEKDFPAFSAYLVNERKLNEAYIGNILRSLQNKGKVALEDIVFAARRQISHRMSGEFDTPAVKLILLLKSLKEKPVVNESLKRDIDWSVEKITLGKVYDTELEPPSPATSLKYSNEVLLPAMAKLTEMLPWLAHFSNPRVNMEDLEAYERAKKRNAGIKPIEKRKSVMVIDLAKDIETNMDIMKMIHSPHFNTFEVLKKFGRKKVLPLISYDIFKVNDAFDLISEEKFEDFVVAIRNGYNQENPFHNDIHVSDVLQMCHYMLNNGLIEIAQLDKVDVAAFLIAAITHDFKHPGVSNSFLQNTSSDLALIYNDQSVLENYHISETFQVIYKNAKCAIFEQLTPEQSKMMRKRIIGCVLATDMAKHFEIMTSLKNIISSHEIVKGANAEKIINKKSPLTEFESKQFILSACLHAADIGNPCRVFAASEEWSNRIMEELWRQGDLERRMGLPISHLCDRTSVNVPGSQADFISGFTIPIFEKLSQIFPKFAPMLEYAIYSECQWRTHQQSMPPVKS